MSPSRPAAALAAISFLAVPALARAQTPPPASLTSTVPSLSPTAPPGLGRSGQTTTSSTASTQTSPAPTVTVGAGTLANTGSDAVAEVLLGAVIVAGGLTLRLAWAGQGR